MSTEPADSPAPSLLAVACPHCHAALAVGDDLVQRAARCPLCSQGFLVPEPRATASASATRSGLDAIVSDLPVSTEAEPVDPEMQFAEPASTIVTPQGVITLRRLTDKEKAARRARRNLVMLLGGLAILMAIVFFFGMGPKKH